MTAPDGGISTFTYGNGLLSSVTEPGNRSLTFTHDGSGNLTGLTDAAGKPRTFTYADAHNGHLLTGDGWDPYASTFTYDAATGRLTGAALGAVQSYTILPAALAGMAGATASAQGLAAVTDGNSHTTLYALDAAGRLTAEVQPGVITQSWLYDPYGQLAAATDGDGKVTSYSYIYGSYNSAVGGGDGDLVATRNPLPVQI